MGLVQVLVGKGIYVRNSPDYQINIPLTEGEGSLLQVLEVRKMVVRSTLGLAIKHGPRKTCSWRHWKVRLERFEALAYPEAWAQGTTEADYEFHQAVYSSTHNPVLIQLIQATTDKFNQFWNPNLRRTFLRHDQVSSPDVPRDQDERHEGREMIVDDFIQALTRWPFHCR